MRARTGANSLPSSVPCACPTVECFRWTRCSRRGGRPKPGYSWRRAFSPKTNQGIVITDATANILDANPAFCEMMAIAAMRCWARIRAFSSRLPRSRILCGDLAGCRHHGALASEMWESKRRRWCTSAPGDDIGDSRSVGAVLRYLGVYADITELKQQQQKVEHLAYHDALTKLPNRLLFDDRLDRALAWLCAISRTL